MEDKHKTAETLAPAVEVPTKLSDPPPDQTPPSRRRGGAQKRKLSSLSNLSGHQTSSSKRQAREKPPVVPFHQIHNGPLTRARLQPFFEASEVKSEADVANARSLESRAKKVEEELVAAREDYEALEAKIEAECKKIMSRNVGDHVVPVHCGWFSWTKIHTLEERSLPSFFSGKLENRTPELYMEIRNSIMNKFHANPNTKIELKDLSEISVGDLNAKQEIMEFLDYWGLINYHPFPETESSILNIDADEAEKTDSLLEKLYQFDKEESCAQAVPKSSVATPTLASRLLPESSIADELMIAEGPSVEYHCNSCSADCSRKRYHCQKQADYDLCTECFTSGKFDSDMSPTDFILMEPADAAGASSGKWTDQETLLLLEALELYKENWTEIAEHVATKTKAQCILHFVQMPIEDPFMDCDDQPDVSLKDDVGPLSATEDAHDSKDVNGGAEKEDIDISSPPLSTSIENSKPEGISETQMIQEQGENCILKALREAFEVVGSPHLPEDKFSFSEAGNPVMALAAFLVRLVEPDVVTATTRTSLKSISGNTSGTQLAARHCFLLEDPMDEGKKTADSPSAVTQAVGQKGQNNVIRESKKEDEKSKLFSNKIDLSSEHDIDKQETSVSEVKEQLISPNGECLDNSQASKGPDSVNEKVELGPVTKSDIEKLPKKLEANVELPPTSPEKAKDATSQSLDAPKEDEMSASLSEQKDQGHLVTSDSIVQNGDSKDVREAGDSKNENKDSADTKDDLCIEKVKHAAVTAVSSAAVKAKILADQEEDQIRLLATLLVEKQLRKLETKLAFFTEMDSVVMRVRELLERSKQRLYQERAQIIAVRLGVSNSSSRPMSQSLPVNRAAMHFANSALRPPGSMTFQRPPIARPMMQSPPMAGNSVQSNQGNHSSAGMN
ncbi:SWI/SNF complex subunit SWI3D [Heracleum sosnowskyi]|uniref:SWI/SNF complex subunit SWI3D n=1 Tax=Heracleum sosnowskyi TaxID=360622 RepID=A0AAD8JI48_9APIA|nr:SWI/SNF complex subunit SWI3D [Heracleum sosnowskyi]